MMPRREHPSRPMGLLTMAVVALVIASCQPPAAPDPAPSTTAPGPAAPGPAAARSAPVESEVLVRTVDRQRYDQIVAQRRGKVVLVDFWATWCVLCCEQFPHTVALAQEHADIGLVVLSASMNDVDDLDAVKRFLAKHPGPVEHLQSSYARPVDAIDAFELGDGALPHYKLYDRTGKLRHVIRSEPERPLTPEVIDQLVQQLLAESTN